MTLAAAGAPVGDAIAALAATARPLDERLIAKPPAGTSADLQAAQRRLDAWCVDVSGGDAAAFERRLAWDGWTPQRLLPFLVDSGGVAGNGEPRWVAGLVEAIDAARKTPALERLESPSGKPVPFEDLLLPLARWATRTTVSILSTSPDAETRRALFAASAWRDLERGLLWRLANLAGPSLLAEFERQRPAGHALMLRLLDGRAAGEACGTDHYRRFVVSVRQEGLLAFLQRHPVLARLLGQALDGWRDATTELVERLAGDLPDIRTRLGWSTDPGLVVTVDPALSDPHHGGRTVAALTFASGVRLVYKPRDLGSEVAFGEFVAWCNRQAPPVRLASGNITLTQRLPVLIDRSTHGWAEFIDHAHCQGIDGVERFHARAGMLLCVLHLLGATDCHYENLVAHGEHPVLLDAETILQPQLLQPRLAASAPDDGERAWDTVVRTGLLPQWHLSANRQLAMDTSGLGSFSLLQGHQGKPEWRDVNTDNMALALGRWSPTDVSSVPTLAGAVVAPRDHLDALVAGYAAIYRFFVARRDRLLSAARSSIASGEDSERNSPDDRDRPPFRQLADARVRFVPRPTHDYVSVLQASLRAVHLQSGIDRTIVLDRLHRHLVTTAPQLRPLPIQQAERRALERMDVPFFTIAAMGVALDPGDGEDVPVQIVAPGFIDVLTRLENWDEAGLRYQTALIRGLYHARMARALGAGADTILLPNAEANVEPSTFVDMACSLGRMLDDASIVDGHGSRSWLGLVHHSDADRYTLEPLAFDLYSGSSGIALFLATLGSLTGKSRPLELAIAAVAPLREQLHDARASAALAARYGIGGASGMGSIIYALTRLAILLGDDELAEDALRAASLVTQDAVARDRVFDVVAGSAGAILGLLRLHRYVPDPAVLARAVAAGEHLLRHRCCEAGRSTWLTVGEHPLTGFAHGAAGIALALQRLHHATGETRFATAANEAIAFERSVYSHAARNWPDFRSLTAQGADPGFSMMWCHGAPGIGLCRLAALREKKDLETLSEVESAAAATMDFGLRGPDHLCCGNLGRADFLLEAGLCLDRPTLVAHAQAMAAALLERAGRDGFRLVDDMPAAELVPGLFRGVAGIGYELLRLANPGQVPSLLLWD